MKKGRHYLSCIILTVILLLLYSLSIRLQEDKIAATVHDPYNPNIIMPQIKIAVIIDDPYNSTRVVPPARLSNL